MLCRSRHYFLYRGSLTSGRTAPGGRTCCTPFPTCALRNDLSFTCTRLCLSLKQCARFDFQDCCELADHVDRCTVDAAFQCADVGAIYPSLIGQRLLRQTLRVSSLPQVAGKDLSYLHAREASALSCISPRSILDNRRAMSDRCCLAQSRRCSGSRFSWTGRPKLRGFPCGVIILSNTAGRMLL